MELTIAPQSYMPSDESLVRALKTSSMAMAQMVSQQTDLEGVIAFDRADAPLIRQANRAADWDGKPQSLVQLTEHFASKNLQSLVVDPLAQTLNQDPIDHAKTLGYHVDARQLLILKQFIPYAAMNTDLQVIPARAAYRDVKTIYQRMAQTDFDGNDELANQLANVMVDRLDEPRLDLLLGRMDRKPVALAGVYTHGQIGVIVPVYVDPDMRGKRLGLTMLNHVLQMCLRAQLQQIIVDRSMRCYAIPMYQKAGFVLGPTYTRLLKHD